MGKVRTQWRGREKKDRFEAKMGLLGDGWSEEKKRRRKLLAANNPLLFSTYAPLPDKTGRVAATLESILILIKLVEETLLVSNLPGIFAVTRCFLTD